MKRRWKNSWFPGFIVFISKVKVPSKEMIEPGPISLYGAQWRFLIELDEGLASGQHSFVNLKARQLGMSTLLLLLDIFWCYMNPGLQGAIIADTSDNREIFRSTITGMLESLPPGFRIPVKSHNRTALTFANGSRIQYMQAGTGKNSGLGRSRAFSFIHACVPGDTPVLVEDGKIKPISEIKVGDRVLTHTGQSTVVVDAWNSENDKGDLFKITPWLGQAVSFTGDHHIPTQRGIVDARDIRKDDWLVMPLRPISKEVEAIQLPETPFRPQRGGGVSIGSGSTVPLSEEFGFACGYYLAEGHITRQSAKSGKTDRASGIVFARHQNETGYVERAKAALAPYTSRGYVSQLGDSLTVQDQIYGASLATWMDETFGAVAEKRIPDEVFRWGEDFCRGLLTGLLIGDGSKSEAKGQGYDLPRVSLTTIRSSLAMQARDIAASLGIGWASISWKEAGVRHGRNCQKAWNLAWCGDAARKLRVLMNLSAPPAAKRNWIQRYQIRDGAVWLKIRKIETGIKCDRIYDITVEHEDHTFRTPSMAIGNSEMGRWGDQKGIDTLKASLATENPNRLYIWESTALGLNAFYDMYQEAKEDPTQRAFFIGWWSKEIYRIEEGTAEFERWWASNPVLDEKEQAMQILIQADYGHEMRPEQWAWWRKKASIQAESSLLEEFPWHEEVAWQATGSPFFQGKRVSEDIKFLRERGQGFEGYRYELGNSFLTMKCEQVMAGQQAELRIWERPIKNARYVMGGDVAYGRSDKSDKSCLSVWRCYADKLVQVAEWNSNIPETRHVAWVLAHLAGSYRDVMVNLEVNGPGIQVMNEMVSLRQQITLSHLRFDLEQAFDSRTALDQARWFLYHRPDNPSSGYVHNWTTSYNNKPDLMNGYRDRYHTEEVVCRSIPLLTEMSTIVQNGVAIQASGRNKDDRPIAAALATYAWQKWVRVNMMEDGRTFDKETARQTTALQAGTQVVSNIIPMFFAEKRRERSEAELRRLLEN